MIGDALMLTPAAEFSTVTNKADGTARPTTAVLEVRKMTKRFGKVVANDALDLSFSSGRVHALLGENGAGKSTAIKLVGGIQRPDSGQILLGGEPTQIPTPYDASDLGIEIVHQESILVPSLTIAENLALRHRSRGRIDAGLLAKFDEAASRLGFELDHRRSVRDLSIGARQRTDIAIAMMGTPRVLILDEPTPIMSPDERQRFFALIRVLADQGTAVVIVTHRLREAAEHCDDVSVLRAGRRVAAWTGPVLPSQDELLEAMMGAADSGRTRSVSRPVSTSDGAPVLVVSKAVATVSERLRVEVPDLVVRRGQVVGIGGIEGTGQRELASLLIGQLIPEHGKVDFAGRPIGSYDAGELYDRIGDVPDEPDLASAGGLPVWQNLALPSLLHGSRFRTSRRSLRQTAEETIVRFDIRTTSASAPVNQLSGGNKRRVVLARETHVKRPDLLVLTYATRGLDARATANIINRVRELAEAGTAVVFISSDLEELLEVCGWVAVLVDGALSPMFASEGLDVLQLATRMLGGSESSETDGGVG